MIGGFKTVSLAWIKKTAVIGYTWLFVYKLQGRNACPSRALGILRGNMRFFQIFRRNFCLLIFQLLWQEVQVI